jgi:hypothetical protein
MVGKAWNLAFVVATAPKGTTRFKPLGLRRITMRLEDGSILQVSRIQFQLGLPDPATRKLSRDNFNLQIEVVNPALQRHYEAGTAPGYLTDAFYRDSRRFFEAIAKHAAEQAGFDKVLITSSASTGAPGLKLKFTAAFSLEDGRWRLHRPRHLAPDGPYSEPLRRI